MTNDKKLLPSGFYDVLPPQATQEAELSRELMSCFAAFGYEQVNPPLLEFESTLFSGRGESLAPQTFRLMDPATREMMGLRADMTYQVARIATSRLKSAPRPLRLSYTGSILLMKAEPLKNERELTQAGFELIGSTDWQADAEVMLLAAESLNRIGLKDISIDINLPGLTAELIGQTPPKEKAALEEAIHKKDLSRIPASLANLKIIEELIGSAGKASNTLKKLTAASMPEFVRNHASALSPITEYLTRQLPNVALSIDPLEARGFEYHQGISFSVFAKGARHEIGRGGRYLLPDGTPGTGFTLYVTHLLRLLPQPSARKSKAVAFDTPLSERRTLEEQGLTTIAEWKTNG